MATSSQNDNNDGNTTTSTRLPILVHCSPFLNNADNNDNTAVAFNQALVILNSPIRSPPSPLFQQLWDKSSVRVCADGGANRLYRANKELIPNWIRGDLDSLDPTVRSYYESKRVSIERDPNQDNNDLDKSLTAVLSSSSTFTRVIIYGAFGGRFDQEMGAIQALYKWSPRFQYRLVLFDDITSAILLPANVKNEIRLPRYGDILSQQSAAGVDADTTSSIIVLGEGPTCGLIPIGCKCDSVATSGFKWDLDGSIPLEFGGLVSTSNHVSEPVVTVESSHPLIFTAEVMSGVDNVF